MEQFHGRCCLQQAIRAKPTPYLACEQNQAGSDAFPSRVQQGRHGTGNDRGIGCQDPAQPLLNRVWCCDEAPNCSVPLSERVGWSSGKESSGPPPASLIDRREPSGP
jgi:hypothetical protein